MDKSRDFFCMKFAINDNYSRISPPTAKPVLLQNCVYLPTESHSQLKRQDREVEHQK
jgi:hypothetical protein